MKGAFLRMLAVLGLLILSGAFYIGHGLADAKAHRYSNLIYSSKVTRPHSVYIKIAAFEFLTMATITASIVSAGSVILLALWWNREKLSD